MSTNLTGLRLVIGSIAFASNSTGSKLISGATRILARKCSFIIFSYESEAMDEPIFISIPSVPREFVYIQKNQELFEEYGYAFVLGLKGCRQNKKNEEVI